MRLHSFLRAAAIAAAAIALVLTPARAAEQIGFSTFTATIVSGQSLSAEVDLGANAIVGIAMPAAWTAADLTFQVSIDGGVTWLELQSISAAIDFKAAAGQFIAVDPTQLRGFNAIKVRSGTSGVPVNQGATAVLTLMGRAY